MSSELCEGYEIDFDGVRQMCQDAKARGFRPTTLFLHWSAGHYGQHWSDYHLQVDGNSKIYRNDSELDDTLAHTWHRNTNAIGLSFCGCFDARANSGEDLDMGTEPVTAEMLETMAKLIAVITEEFRLPITEDTVMTHCEAAELDDYGPGSGDPQTRWDLWYLPDSDGTVKPGGDVLRGKAYWYRNSF